MTFGTPNPSSDKVAESADVAALCVPWHAPQEAIQSSGTLGGKILIDATNPLANDLSGLVVGLATSAAEQVANGSGGSVSWHIGCWDSKQEPRTKSWRR